ncbi:MAG: UDP-N-acetylglucosamine 1-carboxyvinyltransferase [Candidatus Krumholzibacteriia bacterium]
MDRFVIEGPTRLEGEVAVAGAKNAVLPLMAASLLARGESVIENVPDLQDVRFFLQLLQRLGVRGALEDHVLRLDTSAVESHEAPYDVVRKMRASIYVLGPLLARRGRARVSLPGGCAWGPRPVDLHLGGLRALGAELRLDEGYIDAFVDGGLRGGRFRFEPSSVGATANVLMAAVLADGETVLENAALEPEVSHLALALVESGARIEGIGTPRLAIRGVAALAPLRTRVIADRIEAGTFLAAVAVAGGRVRLTGCDPEHLGSVLAVLEQAGCRLGVEGRDLLVEAEGRPRPLDLVTRPYPGLPTDMQAQLMAACALADGDSRITETIYLDRFTHVAELVRLGARIRVDGATAVVEGMPRLQGAPVMATDLRASAALVLAGVAAHGTTRVNRVYHIDRGYERIEEKLGRLGARIRRERD